MSQDEKQNTATEEEREAARQALQDLDRSLLVGELLEECAACGWRGVWDEAVCPECGGCTRGVQSPGDEATPSNAPDLTQEQQLAVTMVVEEQPRLCCLTGGPGTGKSTTIRAIVSELRRVGLSSSLCAPSGKAAKRIQEATGFDARTIHSLIQAKPGADRGNLPVETPVLIVDEASMVDLSTMAMLLRSCKEHVQTVLLVGDVNQLPPVGAGKPFHDVVDNVPTVRLTQIHRQAAGSGIILSAHAVRDGKPIVWSDDARFLSVNDDSRLLSTVTDLINKENLQSVQVLTPARKGALGSMAYNEHVERLRAHAGPAILRTREYDGSKYMLPFREGSRVICTSNDYNRNVFNGETGTVVTAKRGHDPDHDMITVLYEGHDEPVRYYMGSGFTSQLDLAWALTVHKSQGSEWDNVVLVMHRSYGRLLQRNLIYVALTRAKKRLWVVGEDAALQQAIQQPWAESKRTTFLPALFGQAAGMVGASAPPVTPPPVSPEVTPATMPLGPSVEWDEDDDGEDPGHTHLSEGVEDWDDDAFLLSDG